MQLLKKFSFVLFGLLLSQTLYSRPVKIKLGTFVPDQIFLVQDLKKMGSQLTKKSKGQVRMKIYAGGVAGDEPTMVRKLSVGQLNAATLTVIGLTELVPDMLVFNTPLLFNDIKESQTILDDMKSNIEQKFEEKGYKIVQWASLGQVYLFSKTKVSTPGELDKLKLFVGTPEGSEIYQKAGFTTVDISTTDTLMSLSTNLVNAFNTIPLYALANQWFGAAPNMLDLPLSPAVAATVVKKKIWDALSKENREFFLSESSRIAEAAEKKIKEFDSEARNAMIKNGLKIHSITQAERKQWEKRFSSIYCLMREKSSKDTFDLVVKKIATYRGKKGFDVSSCK